MAVNDFESMNVAFVQGTVDCTYICITPGRKNVENPPLDRLTWPTYGQAELHIDPPFLEAHLAAAARPFEHKTAASRLGDPRY